MDQKDMVDSSCDAVSLDVKGKAVHIKRAEIYSKVTSLEVDDETLLRIAELRGSYIGNTGSEVCWA